MRLVVLGVLEEDLIHVCASVLVKFVAAAEDYESDLTVTENTQLVGFLHHPKLPFVESDLSVPLVRDAGYLDFLATHSPMLLCEARS